MDKYPTLGAVDAAIAAAKGEPPRPNEPTKLADDSTARGLTRDDLIKAMNERDAGYAQVLALSTTLTAKHLRDFNEVLDMNAVIAHAQTKKLALLDAYKDKYAEQIKAKSDSEEKTRIDKLVNEQLAEERKKHVEGPYPLRNASPSVLDVIEQKGDPSKYSVDTAMAEYERLQSARG